MALYRNATPNMYFTGYKDTPKPGLQDGSVATPLHLPLTMVNAAWGEVGMPILCMGGEFVTQFSEETWNVRGKFFNHQSLFAKLIQSKANAQFVYRLPTEGAATGKVRLAIEFVEADLPVYERNQDGTIKRDPATGNAIVVPDQTVAGYKFRLIYVHAADLATGTGTELVGTLAGKDGAAARILPIMDIEGTYVGSRANNFGINLFQPKASNPQAVDLKTIKENGNMIYRMFVTETPANGGTDKPWYTKLATEYMDFSFEPESFSTLGASLDFGEVYRDRYVTDNQRYNGLNTRGPIDNSHVYYDNVAEVLGLFHAAEKAVANNKAFVHESNIYSINLLGDTDQHNIPYSAIAEAGVADLTDESYVAAEGNVIRPAHGSDGDLSLDKYEEAVRNFCDSFGIAAPNLADLKRFPFHWIWDSGFKIETKKKLQGLMSKRPDLFVATCTFQEGEPMLDVAGELTVSTGLQSNAAMFPESVIYKTQATRGSIMPWAIRLRNHEYKKPTTLNYDFCEKVCEYLGSADGVWVTAKAIDTYPNNVIKHELLNYQYAALPVREDMWANQMIAVEFGDLNEVIYSGLQTVQPNESSVLNSFPVVAAMIHTTWACIKANRKFVGQSIEAGLLIKRSNEEVTNLCSGIDKAKAIVTPFTEITPEDNDAGYAWHTGADVAANGMKTVNTIEVRSSWLDAQ